MATKFVAGKPSGSKIYNDLLQAIMKMTSPDIRWGFVKTRSKVQYITSEQVPIRIVFVHKFKGLKWTPDVAVVTQWQPGWTNDIWIAAISAEVYCRLQPWSDKIGLKKYDTHDEYSMMIMTAFDQITSHDGMRKGREVNSYHDKCLAFGVG